MNKKEIRTIKQEAERFMKDIVLLNREPMVRLELPFKNRKGDNIYFYVTKYKESKKFTLMISADVAGLIPAESTLAIIQPILKGFGLIISDKAIIMEDSTISLHIRIQNMTQALIAIDGMCRLYYQAMTIGE